jgi:hypothetical protein
MHAPLHDKFLGQFSKPKQVHCLIADRKKAKVDFFLSKKSDQT